MLVTLEGYGEERDKMKQTVRNQTKLKPVKATVVRLELPLVYYIGPPFFLGGGGGGRRGVWGGKGGLAIKGIIAFLGFRCK